MRAVRRQSSLRTRTHGVSTRLGLRKGQKMRASVPGQVTLHLGPALEKEVAGRLGKAERTSDAGDPFGQLWKCICTWSWHGMMI